MGDLKGDLAGRFRFVAASRGPGWLGKAQPQFWRLGAGILAGPARRPRTPWPLVHGPARRGRPGQGHGALELPSQPWAPRRGLAILLSESVGNNWNDGRQDFKIGDTDDSGFLAALAQGLVEQKLANPSRLYVCGISNGGMMSLRLACEHADLFAAVGVVAASQPATFHCQPSALPLCFIFGRQDPLMPYAGGPIRLFRGARSRGKVLPLEETLASGAPRWPWPPSASACPTWTPRTAPASSTGFTHLYAGIWSFT